MTARRAASARAFPPGREAPVPRYDSENREYLERYLVGGLLGASGDDPGLAAEALDLCPAGSVVSPGLCEVWDAVAALCARGVAVDILAVFDWLHARHARGESPRDADAAHLAALSQTPFATREAVLSFADKLARLIRRGRLADLFRASAADCLVYGEDPDAIVARTLRRLEAETAATEVPALGPLLAAVLDDMTAGKGARPLPTPWPDLNAVLKGGAVPGELVVLAGRPGLGKTALAGCWAVEAARRSGPVLFVSCEVRDKTLAARLLARESGIDGRVFRQGAGSGPPSAAREAAARLTALPLSIVDSSRRAPRPAEIRKLARRIKGGPVLVVVDYLQLLYPDEKRDSREREVAETSRAMKRLALELNCPVLLLSQLNRRAEEGRREPQLADLRESGAVEQDADIVIMLHTEKRHMDEGLCPVRALVRKGRSSGTGAAALLFDKARADFRPDPDGRARRREAEPENPDDAL